ncbi:unnamed protein product [Arctogadus glacialis]
METEGYSDLLETSDGQTGGPARRGPGAAGGGLEQALPPGSTDICVDNSAVQGKAKSMMDRLRLARPSSMCQESTDMVARWNALTLERVVRLQCHDTRAPPAYHRVELQRVESGVAVAREITRRWATGAPLRGVTEKEFPAMGTGP